MFRCRMVSIALVLIGAGIVATTAGCQRWAAGPGPATAGAGLSGHVVDIYISRPVGRDVWPVVEVTDNGKTTQVQFVAPGKHYPLAELLKGLHKSDPSRLITVRAKPDIDYQYIEPVLISMAEAGTAEFTFEVAGAKGGRIPATLPVIPEGELDPYQNPVVLKIVLDVRGGRTVARVGDQSSDDLAGGLAGLLEAKRAQWTDLPDNIWLEISPSRHVPFADVVRAFQTCRESHLGQMVALENAREEATATASLTLAQAAAGGDVQAMYGLGLAYMNGDGAAKDYGEALKWFRKAADGGSIDALVNIGYMYENGLGVARSNAEAGKAYRKAATAGSGIAMFDIGVHYRDGNGVAQDYVEALTWFRKAADAGNVDGVCAVGYAYGNGQGVPQSYSEAAKWFHRAAGRDDAYAMYYLGIMYANGGGVARDEAEAVRWMRKAADAGNVDAMYIVGGAYDQGRGVKADRAEAEKWMRKAADLGHEPARAWLALHKAASATPASTGPAVGR